MRTKYDLQLDRFLASHFPSWLMSNAKWRKAFHILWSPALGLTIMFYKTVGEEHIRSMWRPFEPERIQERGLGDGSGGPLDYRLIERIEVPTEYVEPARPTFDKELLVIHQDVELVVRALSKAGQFPIELTDAGLRLYGYR